MNPFDKIIGYETIKKELERTAGVLKDSGKFKKLGVSAPSGLMLHGDPGVGKSLMANCLIEASGLPVFICRKDQPILHQLEKELNEAGIRGIYSEHIRRDALKKFCYVSPIGAAGLYYDANAGTFQKEGPARDLYIGMMKEIEALAAAMGCAFDTDVIEANLNIVAHQPPEATTSMQRDVQAGGPSEIQGLVYDIPAIGKRYQVEMPLYEKVSEELKKRFSKAGC